MIVAVVGPTGIGKTTLGIALAKYFNTDVISGDSIQVYKQLDIGSAKVRPEEMDGVIHHQIDVLEPTDNYSVALFQRDVRANIAEMEQQGKMPLIVGGTGLYIKSVLYDYNFTDTKRDKDFERHHQNKSNEALYQLLLEQDEQAAKKLHPNNRKRVLQALGRSETNKVSENSNKDVPVYDDFIIIGLRMERDELYPIINKRVDQMIDEGLVEEVRHLYDQGVQSNAIQAIGYKELYRYFKGEWTLDEAIAKIKQHSRNLAKKQYTFFGNQFDVHWLDVDLQRFDQTIREAIQLIESKR